MTNRINVRLYLAVFAALLVLTGVTVAVSELDVSRHAAIAIAVAIASLKGLLVALVFMHLSHERRWLHGMLTFTIFIVINLMFWSWWQGYEHVPF